MTREEAITKAIDMLHANSNFIVIATGNESRETETIHTGLPMTLLGMVHYLELLFRKQCLNQMPIFKASTGAPDVRPTETSQP